LPALCAEVVVEGCTGTSEDVGLRKSVKRAIIAYKLKLFEGELTRSDLTLSLQVVKTMAMNKLEFGRYGSQLLFPNGFGARHATAALDQTLIRRE
jgi:hypothetical protein